MTIHYLGLFLVSEGWLIFGEFGCFWKKKTAKDPIRNEQEIMQTSPKMENSDPPKKSD